MYRATFSLPTLSKQSLFFDIFHVFARFFEIASIAFCVDFSNFVIFFGTGGVQKPDFSPCKYQVFHFLTQSWEQDQSRGSVFSSTFYINKLDLFLVQNFGKLALGSTLNLFNFNQYV